MRRRSVSGRALAQHNGPRIVSTQAEAFTTFRGASAHMATITLHGASASEYAHAEALHLDAWCRRDPHRRGVWHVSQPVPSGLFIAPVLGEADRVSVEHHAARAVDALSAALRLTLDFAAKPTT